MEFEWKRPPSRGHGRVGSFSGLELNTHGCLVFDDREEFRRASVEWLTDGRRLGQRLMFTANVPESDVREEIAGLEGFERLIADDALRVASVADMYSSDVPVDPEGQLATYVALTEEALADGYAGLRVVADGTSLLATPEAREPFLRWECLAERYMATNPLAGLCCFDRRAVPDEVLSQFACAHPVVAAPERLSPFRLYAEDRKLVLDGEVDSLSTAKLDRLLELAGTEGREMVLDLSGLKFADAHSVRAIARHSAASEGGRFRIEGVPSHVRRVGDLVDVDL